SLERGHGVLAGARVAHEPGGDVVGEDDAVALLRDGVRVDVLSEGPRPDSRAVHDGDRVEQVGLVRDEPLPYRAVRQVVELHRSGGEHAATGHRVLGVGVPPQPALDERAQARLPRRLAQRGQHDVQPEAVRGEVERLDLEPALGPEVREQTALRHLEPVGERPDGQAVEADDARLPQRLAQGELARLRALAHDLGHPPIKARSFGRGKVRRRPISTECTRRRCRRPADPRCGCQMSALASAPTAPTRQGATPMNPDPNIPTYVAVVERNAGVFLGSGIVAQVLGLGIQLNNLGSLRPSSGAVAIGGLLVLVGLALLVTGIAKVVKNVEATATATVTAENLLRDIRNVTLAQYHENRNA